MERRNPAIEIKTDAGTTSFDNAAAQGDEQYFDTHPFNFGRSRFGKNSL